MVKSLIIFSKSISSIFEINIEWAKKHRIVKIGMRKIYNKELHRVTTITDGRHLICF